MKQTIEYENFNRLLQITDWRYAAAAVGLKEYLDFCKIPYKILNDLSEPPKEAIIGFDGLLYCQEDITEERFLRFVEDYFAEDMTHLKILDILESDTFDTESIKKVKELLAGKTIFKTIFGKEKFDGTNKELFIKGIEENRLEIIKAIFKNGKNLYAAYSNTNLFLTDSNPHCRLSGYSVDEGRKTKMLGYQFQKDSFIGNDILEFDFIPCAFTKTFESYFINNNFSIFELCQTKQTLEKCLKKAASEEIKKNSRTMLFDILKNTENFVHYDVEIIVKNRDQEYYETLFVRNERLKYLKEIQTPYLSFKYKITDDYWLDLEKEVYERCLNNVGLDDLIELLLKLYFQEDIKSTAVKNRTDTLIKINEHWKGDFLVNEIDYARKMGFAVSQELLKQKKGNKINSYKQKLVGALVAHDYDRVNEIILSLASYMGMEFSFAYPLFEAPEENKNIAFAFVNALTENTKSNDNKGE
ncbi:MAG: type I CRISPR-associated protein Cas8a1/Csx8 [Acutalibacteraceae bacterium]